jgi:hypothetical protein
MNSYLIEWNKGYGDSGTYSVSSTAELLDFFDTRVRSEAAYYTFTNADDVDDFDVSALAGSTNPLTDIYKIVKFANSRQPGEVIEGEPLAAPPLSFAAFQLGATTLHSFGSDPSSAVTKLLSTWIEITSGDATINPQLIHDHRAELIVRQVSAGTAYGYSGDTRKLDLGEGKKIRGDDPAFDDIFHIHAPSTSAPRF